MLLLLAQGTGNMPHIPADWIGWAALAVILFFPVRGLLRLLRILN